MYLVFFQVYNALAFVTKGWELVDTDPTGLRIREAERKKD